LHLVGLSTHWKYTLYVLISVTLK
jgi:hypothetical protein